MKLSWIIAIAMVSLLLLPGFALAQFNSRVNSSALIYSNFDTIPPNLELLVNNKRLVESINNGGFENSLEGWFIQGVVQIVSTDTFTDLAISPTSGERMVRIGSTTTFSSDNRIFQSFPNAANLQLSYYLVTSDYHPFDRPAFIVRLNGQVMFQQDTKIANPAELMDGVVRGSGWRQLNFNLSQFLTDNVTLEIIVSNNGSGDRPTWAYVDNITTDISINSSQSSYHIHASDNDEVAEVWYQVNDSPWKQETDFQLLQAGDYKLSFYAIDKTGNQSQVLSKKIKIDNTPPYSISDLLIDKVGANNVWLSWFPTNDEDQVISNLYYQPDCVDSDSINNSDLIHAEILTTGRSNLIEMANVTGLNPDTNYCFFATSSDAANNISFESNIATTSTKTSSEQINPGDLIINEMMWMGTTESTADEWIEIKNNTNRTIDLTQVRLTGIKDGIEVEMDIDFTGESIEPFGYFLISNWDTSRSLLKTAPDLVDTSIELNNSDLLIRLYNQDLLIDTAGSGGQPPAGINYQSAGRYSAQRASGKLNPESLNWFTAIDPSFELLYFKQGPNRGTPSYENH